MNPFEYQRAGDAELAVKAISAGEHVKLLAGGTNLIDLMKNGVEHPTKLVDVGRLPLANIETLPDGGLRIGALARNNDTANHALVRSNYPLLTQAILAGASPQLRNMATNGGNLMQRTRCYYFMDPGFAHCNKRTPGSGCAALEGLNRIHAILGASEQCIATNPSDMSVALAALEATIRVRGPRGERTIPIADFHRLPGTTPNVDTNLKHDELIVSIDLPRSPYARHSHYLKVRDRASYAFALVSVAAALDLDGDQIRSARVALGGVAHKPWRSLEAEKSLTGKAMNARAFEEAASVALTGAKTYRYNEFKVQMAKHAIVSALTTAGGAA
ncbi:MAG TPA: xanthine dehydrogenase family protein subunit M [Candidatus Acidoferrum sp.]|jgi:xanthine dehydrogenase YagS FAD-binding subunit